MRLHKMILVGAVACALVCSLAIPAGAMMVTHSVSGELESDDFEGVGPCPCNPDPTIWDIFSTTGTKVVDDVGLNRCQVLGQLLHRAVLSLQFFD